MITIKQINDNKLVIENYNNKLNNLCFFDVLDGLESQGISIRLNEYNGNVSFIYNRKVYPLRDSDIATLENYNRIELIARGQ
jgi:hypothetical protein